MIVFLGVLVQCDHPTGKKQRFRLQPTKKVECEAIMNAIVINIYPQFKLTGAKNPKDEKAKVSR